MRTVGEWMKSDVAEPDRQFHCIFLWMEEHICAHCERKGKGLWENAFFGTFICLMDRNVFKFVFAIRSDDR